MEELSPNTCRICLKTQETVFSLFLKRKGISPSDNLGKLGVQIKSSDLGPACICYLCLTELETALRFIQKCEKSSNILLELCNQEAVNRSINLDLKHEFYESDTAHNDSKDCEKVLHVIDRAKEGAINLGCRDSEGKRSEVNCIEEQKCQECGSRRRCHHWTPPTTRTCPHCQKQFNRKFNFDLHMKRHLGERDYACNTCGAATVTQWLAQRHCIPRRRLPCPVAGCPKSYTTSTNLRTHIRSHNGERPFECADCGKKFTSKNTLSEHMRIHTGVKPYMCPVCGKQFTTNKLSVHMLSHEPSGRPRRTEHSRRTRSARLVPCSLCPARYRHTQSLNKHFKKHHQNGVAHVQLNNVSKQINGL